ncbi:deaminase domain-containing protein [Shewanella algae]|uniref:deaminase domain-containing protein n=1 Tax=Shewanella algae TaxID=38313 RepID=UPI000D4D57C2|nr:hypothetical protein AYI85_11155 [Shewanella algae]TVL01231.1 hypothetical protein AYI84_16605 [Shewanella algae]TVL50213.1 hypothetical protein AYI99_09400 [Shewanella algae]
MFLRAELLKKLQGSDNVRVGTPDAYTRQWDTEFKILNDVALRLGNNRNATGSINLFTERLTCTSALMLFSILKLVILIFS